MKDEDHVFDLEFAGRQIRNWKRWYFKSNTRKPTAIKLRCNFAAPEQIFWKYYLELWRDGKLDCQIRIRPEAYDTMTRDPKLPREEYTGIEFVTYLKIN